MGADDAVPVQQPFSLLTSTLDVQPQAGPEPAGVPCAAPAGRACAQVSNPDTHLRVDFVTALPSAVEPSRLCDQMPKCHMAYGSMHEAASCTSGIACLPALRARPRWLCR